MIQYTYNPHKPDLMKQYEVIRDSLNRLYHSAWNHPKPGISADTGSVLRHQLMNIRSGIVFSGQRFGLRETGKIHQSVFDWDQQ